MPDSPAICVCCGQPASWRCTAATDASGPVGHLRCDGCVAATCADFEALDVDVVADAIFRSKS